MQKSELKSERRPGWVESEGVMTGITTGDRLMVIPTRFIANAKQFLQSAYGDSVRLVMNRLAREIGLSYGNLWKENSLAPAESLKLLVETAEKAGWGRLKIDGDLDGGKKLTLAVTNCAFCTAQSRGADGKCDFMAGIAEGICKATYDKEYRSDLQDPSGVSSETCVLALREANGQKKENWKTAVYFPWLIESQ